MDTENTRVSKGPDQAPAGSDTQADQIDGTPGPRRGALEVPLDDYDGQPLWNEIVPGLWMGGTGIDEELSSGPQAAGITPDQFDTVITLYRGALPVDYYVKELRLGFYDHEHIDVDPIDLGHVVVAGHGDWMRGKRVLVRCQAGWNRSGLVTALVLIRAGYDPAEAIELIREKRSAFALCNDHFASWLVEHGGNFVRGLPQISSQETALIA